MNGFSVAMALVDYIPVLFFAAAAVILMRDLSSKDFAEAAMNWIAEGVNVVGQGTLLLGTVLLHKAGLADARLHGEAA